MVTGESTALSKRRYYRRLRNKDFITAHFLEGKHLACLESEGKGIYKMYFIQVKSAINPLKSSF